MPICSIRSSIISSLDILFDVIIISERIEQSEARNTLSIKMSLSSFSSLDSLKINTFRTDPFSNQLSKNFKIFPFEMFILKDSKSISGLGLNLRLVIFKQLWFRSSRVTQNIEKKQVEARARLLQQASKLNLRRWETESHLCHGVKIYCRAFQNQYIDSTKDLSVATIYRACFGQSELKRGHFLYHNSQFHLSTIEDIHAPRESLPAQIRNDFAAAVSARHVFFSNREVPHLNKLPENVFNVIGCYSSTRPIGGDGLRHFTC
ncbi:hypothetical protein BpHYR1_042249 [Brachionus plicatilis]|uniref:Uncharacterized protein n=1 Tax=Brachionus plicatilis TaxID=10195 RepID=A0A3M7SPX6_BRAPC|nr:hypothetical protein BpHYR1_042249 [Brachionus plicatilis]